MEEKVYVVIGNTPDTGKYWYKIYKGIKDVGWKVYCVNEKIDEVEGQKIYNSLQDLPEQGTAMILVAKPDVSARYVDEAIESGYKEIWFQPGTYSEEASAKAENKGIRVYNQCFMVANDLW